MACFPHGLTGRLARPSPARGEEDDTLVFCPNCGTKNADTEAKCAQCGFDLQAKAPQARFKGTMVMAPSAAKPPAAAGGSPAPSAAGPTPPKSSALKGTMIGVAPPEMARALEEAKAKAAAQAAPTPAEPAPAAPAAPAGAKPALKGTMIGVAPPDMQAAIAAAKAKIGGADAPAAGAPPAAAAPAASTKGGIKGTMIGVAPPDMHAAIAAAKADLEKRAAEEAAGAAARAPAPAKPESPLARAPNSKLKGTMLGVAPPDVAQAMAEAKANAATAPTPREGVAAAGRAPKQDFAATMVGTAEPVRESLRPGPTAERAPTQDFKGTMVGATSPLVESDAGDLEANGPDSRARGNSDHPAAFASTSLSEQAEIMAARANLQRVLAEAEEPRPPTGRDIPTGAQSPAAIRSIAQSQKKSALPILLLGLAFVVVAVLIGVALLSRSSAPAEDPKAVPSATPQ